MDGIDEIFVRHKNMLDSLNITIISSIYIPTRSPISGSASDPTQSPTPEPTPFSPDNPTPTPTFPFCDPSNWL